MTVHAADSLQGFFCGCCVDLDPIDIQALTLLICFYSVSLVLVEVHAQDI